MVEKCEEYDGLRGAGSCGKRGKLAEKRIIIDYDPKINRVYISLHNRCTEPDHYGAFIVKTYSIAMDEAQKQFPGIFQI